MFMRDVSDRSLSLLALRDQKPESWSCVIRNQLIASLARQDERSHRNGQGAESLKAPGNGAHDPTLVKIPANKEAIVVFEEVGL